jgi:hypothetical protein
MILGVMADSHGNKEAVVKALSIFTDNNISIVLHAGDFGPASNYELYRDFVLHLVKGNNDSLDELQFYAEKYGQPAVMECKTIMFGHKDIFLFHGDQNRMYRDALAGNYSYIIRGHSHFPENFKVKRTVVLNPGALYRTSEYSVGILDLDRDTWCIKNL